MKKKLVMMRKDLHPITLTVKSRKRKRAAFEALQRIEQVDLDRKDGLMSPVKPEATIDRTEIAQKRLRF